MRKIVPIKWESIETEELNFLFSEWNVNLSLKNHELFLSFLDSCLRLKDRNSLLGCISDTIGDLVELDL